MSDGGHLTSHLAEMQQRCAVIAPGQVGDQARAALLVGACALADRLARARQDLSALGSRMTVGQIANSAAELEAVVTHTQTATIRILSACEGLEQAVAGCPCDANVAAATARVYEACSFQDITAQRMAKVVQTLHLLEAEMAAILGVVGLIRPVGLNGPQQSQAVIGQSVIDRIWAECE